MVVLNNNQTNILKVPCTKIPFNKGNITDELYHVIDALPVAEKESALRSWLQAKLGASLITNETEVEIVVSNNFSQSEEIVPQTPNQVVKQYKKSKAVDAETILALAPNQRIFTKSLKNIKTYFASTFNEVIMPTIIIAKQDIEFFKEHNFSGHFFNNSIVSRTELATSLNRIKVVFNPNLKTIELVLDGQQRITMTLIIFDGDIDGMTPHFNLDEFIVYGNTVIAPEKVVEYHNVASVAYTNFMNGKKNHELLKQNIITQLMKGGKGTKSDISDFTKNIFPCNEVQRWENLSNIEILKSLVVKYGFVDLDGNTNNYLKIIDALKKYYFNRVLLNYHKKSNLNHTQIKETFTVINTEGDGVLEAELVEGYFNDSIPDTFEELISNGSKLLMYLGMKDSRDARGLTMRAIMTLMGWSTSMGDTLKLIKTNDPVMIEMSDELKVAIPALTEAILHTREFFTKKVNGKKDLADNIAEYTRTNAMDNNDIALFNLLILILKYDGAKKGINYLTAKSDELDFIYKILNLKIPMVSLFGTERSNSHSRLRKFAVALESNGGLTVKSLIKAGQTLGYNFFQPLNSSEMLEKNTDLHTTRKYKIAQKYVNHGRKVSPVKFDFDSIEIEHNIASDNFKNQKTFGAYHSDNNINYKIDDEFKERLSFCKKYGDSYINKCGMHFSLNKKIKKSPISVKFSKIERNYKAEYLKLIHFDKIYANDSFTELMNVGHEPIQLFLGYRNDIRTREEYNKELNTLLDKNHTYTPMTEDEIFEMFVTKTFYDEDGVKQFSNILSGLRTDFAEIKDIL